MSPQAAPENFEHLAQAIDALPLVVCVLRSDEAESRPHWRLESINAFGGKTLQVDRNQWLGAVINESFPILGQPAFLTPLASLAKANDEVDLGQHRAPSGQTLTLLAKFLDPKVVCIQGFPTNEPAGRGAISSIETPNDLAPVSRVDKMLRDLVPNEESAESVRRVKHAFFSNMSHELRTPLNAILGFAQLMGRSGELTDEQKSHLEIIHNSGRHLLELVNELLEIARKEAGGAILPETVFDSKRITSTVVPAAQPPRRISSLAPGQRTFKVLIAEDRWENRKLLEALLLPLGFLVRIAVDGSEAIAIWREWQPDVILMDMQMPVVDGYQATEEIKKASKNKNISIIALSASAFEENRERLEASGCDDFLRKPFQPDDILGALERHLGVKYVEEVTDLGVELASHELKSAARADITVAWKSAFLQANEELDVQAMERLLSQLSPTQDAFVESLRKLVHDYAFEQVVQFLATIEPRE